MGGTIISSLEPQNMDEALALRSLVEGDAMLASNLVERSWHGIAPAESIAGIEQAAQANEDSALRARRGGLGAVAPPLV
jgi:hypothetical protein